MLGGGRYGPGTLCGRVAPFKKDLDSPRALGSNGPSLTPHCTAAVVGRRASVLGSSLFARRY